jgi:hypothetical protein
MTPAHLPRPGRVVAELNQPRRPGRAGARTRPDPYTSRKGPLLPKASDRILRRARAGTQPEPGAQLPLRTVARAACLVSGRVAAGA